MGDWLVVAGVPGALWGSMRAVCSQAFFFVDMKLVWG